MLQVQDLYFMLGQTPYLVALFVGGCFGNYLSDRHIMLSGRSLLAVICIMAGAVCAQAHFIVSGQSNMAELCFVTSGALMVFLLTCNGGLEGNARL